MTNPSGLPSFDQLYDDALRRHQAEARERADLLNRHQQNQANQLAAHGQASQDLTTISDQLTGYVDFASQYFLDHNTKGIPLTTEKIAGRGRLDLYGLTSDKIYGAAPERVLLAPQVGRLVTAHMYTPSTLQALEVDMSPAARQHREQGGYLHTDNVNMLLAAGRIIEPPSERAHRIGNALADLVVTIDEGSLPQLPPQPGPQRNPHDPQRSKFEIPHQLRHWLKR